MVIWTTLEIAYLTKNTNETRRLSEFYVYASKLSDQSVHDHLLTIL